jgi:hypothetical protein
MSEVKTGGPAFPTSDWDENDRAYKMHGMTLRDYFAAKAMEGMLSSGNLPKTISDADIAECAYNLADAMLEARGK